MFIPEDFLSCRAWKATRVLSECEAWIDLVQSARFEATGIYACIGGRKIEYGRGQYPASTRFLAKRWGWATDRQVRNFFDRLRKEHMITTDCNQGMTIITIVDYDKYYPFGAAKYAAKYAAKSCNNSNLSGGSGAAKYAAKYAPCESDEKVYAPNPQIICTRDKYSYNNKGSYIGNQDSYKDNLGTTNVVLPSGTAEQSHPESLNYDRLVEFFNEETKGVFGRIRMPLSAVRRGQIAARAREHGKESLAEVFQRAYRSDFLKGQNTRGWRATFDWLIKPTNFEKVLSGNYDNNNEDTNSRSNSTKADDADLLRNVAEGIARGRFARKQRGEQY